MNEPGPLNPTEQEQLIQRIGRTILTTVPPTWSEVRVDYRAAGPHSEIHAWVTAPNGTLIPMAAPGDLGGMFDQLRTGMYEPSQGTWLTAVYHLRHPSSYSVDFDGEHEPNWVTPPPTGAYGAELNRFPRAPERLPSWLTSAANGSASPGGPGSLPGTPAAYPGANVPTGADTPVPASSSPAPRAPASPVTPSPSAETEATVSPTAPLRRAEIFDGEDEQGNPTVNRAAVPREQHEHLVRYLEDAPIVLAARSYDGDRFDPERTPSVPLTFHTDGFWVWAGAVGYYLRAHGIPPEPDLVEHIRGRGFQLPEVEERQRDRAVATITGQPAGT